MFRVQNRVEELVRLMKSAIDRHLVEAPDQTVGPMDA